MDNGELIGTIPYSLRIGSFWACMQWKGETFIDATLPFGLCSAPMIFTAVADAVEWIARQHQISHIVHYLDDFLIVWAGCLIPIPAILTCQSFLPSVQTLACQFLRRNWRVLLLV